MSGGQIHTKYLGRVELTREALAGLLGLPYGAQADIHYSPEKDMYNVVIRTPEPLQINGEVVTQEVVPCSIIPLVDAGFMSRSTIVTVPDEEDEECLREAMKLQKSDS